MIKEDFTFSVKPLYFRQLFVVSGADDLDEGLFVCSEALKHQNRVSAVCKRPSALVGQRCVSTFMEALSSDASYCALLFIRPNIRPSREPDSAPFRAVIRS